MLHTLVEVTLEAQRVAADGVRLHAGGVGADNLQRQLHGVAAQLEFESKV